MAQEGEEGFRPGLIGIEGISLPFEALTPPPSFNRAPFSPTPCTRPTPSSPHRRHHPHMATQDTHPTPHTGATRMHEGSASCCRANVLGCAAG